MPPPASHRDRQILDAVASRGWLVVSASPRTSGPSWAFSIGLFHSFGHPEVLLFGLPADAMRAILESLGERVKDGAVFRDGTESPEILQGCDVAFRAVARLWYPFVLSYANWFYRSRPFPVLQVLWPDRNREFPWERPFPVDARTAQPLLFLSDPPQARAIPLLYGIVGSSRN